MTDTIPNVPRELLERAATSIEQRMCIQCEGVPCCMPESLNTLSDIRALLSAPSPAGVDGMEVIGWYTEDHLDDKSATTYSREVANRWLAKGWPVTGIANESDAQAIIDGLRGEVAKINSDRLACWAEFKVMTRACLDAEKERDQQARRIGELEGLLLRVQVSISLDDTEWGYSGAEKYKLLADIRAALSAGKDGE